jgi:hypothetical protein
MIWKGGRREELNAYSSNSALMENLIAQVPGLIHFESPQGFQSHEPPMPPSASYKLGSAVIQSMVYAAVRHSDPRDYTQLTQRIMSCALITSLVSGDSKEYTHIY